MSLNKIAKAINNLAKAIRYHADHAGKAPILPLTGSSHGSTKGDTAPQNIPKEIDSVEELLAGENPEAADILNADTPRVNDPAFIAGFDAGLVPAFGGGLMPRSDLSIEDQKNLIELSEEHRAANSNAPDFSDDNSENYVDHSEDISGTRPPFTGFLDNAPQTPDNAEPDDKPDLSALPAYLDKQRNNAEPDDKPSLDVPGWQTLTVEELDVAPPPPPVADDDAAPKGVTVDANGLPWDARIHSSGKTLLADDTWRLKRGVPDDEREAIEAELKQLMAIPVPPAPAVDKDSQAAEVALAVASAPPPPPPAPSAKITLMPQLIKAITGAELGAMIVTEAVKSVGLENISQLGARPDLVPAVAEALGL